MGFDLTNERIQDTYEQLVQISGSKLVDGTGSLITPDITTVSASYAVTASFALNGGGGEWDEITGKPSGLVSSSAQTIANLPSGTISGSSQVDYDSISNVPSGLLSSSAQIADDISGSFTSTSASIASDVATNVSDISTQTSRVDSLVSATSSYAVKSSNNVFSGTQTFNSIAVNGTASIAYLNQITGSAKIIGDEFVVLNADTPAARYAGLKVYDSGSTMATASIEWDGLSDNWLIQEESGMTGVILTGATGSRGSETLPTLNTIQKGVGHHSIGDSNITDDGSKVTVTGNLRATNNIEGGNSNSLSGNRRLVFGSSNNVTADDAINIGGESNSVNASYTFAVGTSGTTVSGGDLSGVVGGYQHTLSGGARNVTIGGESVTNNQDYAIVLGRQSFTTPNSYTTYTANIDASGSATISGSITLTSEEVVNVSSGSATGSLIDNIHPAIASGSSAIKHIVTIDQTAYDTISGSGDVNDDTFYIISDATDAVYPDNLQVAGQIFSPTFAGSVASSTSSIDFNDGNFATLSLTAATFLANPSNLKSGTTYTIIFEQSGSHVSGYGDAFLFAGGTEPTLSDGKDVLTMVSDGTNLYATALTDFS